MQAQTLTFTSCLRISAASSSATWIPSAERLNFGRLRTCTSRFSAREIERYRRLAAVTSQRISGRNDHAHVTLTAEADSLPTDENELLDDCGLVGCFSSRSEDLPVHARIHSSGYVPFLWESDDDRKRHVLHSLTSSLAQRQKSAATQ